MEEQLDGSMKYSQAVRNVIILCIDESREQRKRVERDRYTYSGKRGDRNAMHMNLARICVNFPSFHFDGVIQFISSVFMDGVNLFTLEFSF